MNKQVPPTAVFYDGNGAAFTLDDGRLLPVGQTARQRSRLLRQVQQVWLDNHQAPADEGDPELSAVKVAAVEAEPDDIAALVNSDDAVSTEIDPPLSDDPAADLAVFSDRERNLVAPETVRYSASDDATPTAWDDADPYDAL